MPEIRYIGGMHIWDADDEMTDIKEWKWIKLFRHQEKWEPHRYAPLPPPTWFEFEEQDKRNRDAVIEYRRGGEDVE